MPTPGSYLFRQIFLTCCNTAWKSCHQFSSSGWIYSRGNAQSKNKWQLLRIINIVTQVRRNVSLPWWLPRKFLQRDCLKNERGQFSVLIPWLKAKTITCKRMRSFSNISSASWWLPTSEFDRILVPSLTGEESPSGKASDPSQINKISD